MTISQADRKFSCRSCGQVLELDYKFSAAQVRCPSCGSSVDLPVSQVPAKQKGVTSFVLALVLILIGGGIAYVYLGLLNAPKGSSHVSTESSVSAVEPSLIAPAASIPSAPTFERSGASTWSEAAAFYQQRQDGKVVGFATQAERGKVCFLQALRVERVAQDFVAVTMRGVNEQWVLVPDDPKALENVTIPQFATLPMAVGVFEGSQLFERFSGATDRVPVLRLLGLNTGVGYLNFENPDAPKASSADLAECLEKATAERAAVEAEAAEKARLARAEADETERQGEAASKAKDAEERQRKATSELAQARADLAEVNSRIDSERRRFSEALNTINTLTKNKTMPVKEGSSQHRACEAASRIINEVEQGAGELKAKKARLEALVEELQKGDQ